MVLIACTRVSTLKAYGYIRTLVPQDTDVWCLSLSSKTQNYEIWDVGILNVAPQHSLEPLTSPHCWEYSRVDVRPSTGRKHCYFEKSKFLFPSSVLLNLWPYYCIRGDILFNLMDNKIRIERDVASPESLEYERWYFILSTPDNKANTVTKATTTK